RSTRYFPPATREPTTNTSAERITQFPPAAGRAPGAAAAGATIAWPDRTRRQWLVAIAVAVVARRSTQAGAAQDPGGTGVNTRLGPATMENSAVCGLPSASTAVIFSFVVSGTSNSHALPSSRVAP